jgi:phytanoyl-CoA hydroxylase
MLVSDAQKQFFDENGYVVIDGLFTPEEVTAYRDHYMRLRESGTYPGDDAGINPSSNDPLKRYPRMIHMHRWDDTSMRWMLDARLNECLTALCGGIEPYAVQTMLYFKPPKARGQALHQDNYYLRAQPGTCIAAWMALDPCDEANGCLEVVPGSQTWPILCTVDANLNDSFTDVTVPIPEGQEVRPVVMNAGSVLFFNGSLVHGSKPNITEDRFRRALIGHYVEGDVQQVYNWYQPVFRMDGTVVTLEDSEAGSKCGVWVDKEQVFETVASAHPYPDKTIQ